MAIGTDTAETHVCKPTLTGLIHQTGWPPSLTAKVQPMQCRTAACLKIWLIPHAGRIAEPIARRKCIGKLRPSKRFGGRFNCISVLERFHAHAGDACTVWTTAGPVRRCRHNTRTEPGPAATRRSLPDRRRGGCLCKSRTRHRLRHPTRVPGDGRQSAGPAPRSCCAALVTRRLGCF
jgi:hypothetical protein